MSGKRRRRGSRSGAFSIQMEEITKEVGEVTVQALSDAFDTAAPEIAEDLKASSPKSHGDYARDWTYRVKKDSLSMTVYNKDHYRLTHLLENGHLISNQTGKLSGRVQPRVHIKPARDRAVKRVLDELNKNLDENL